MYSHSTFPTRTEASFCHCWAQTRVLDWPFLQLDSRHNTRDRLKIIRAATGTFIQAANKWRDCEVDSSICLELADVYQTPVHLSSMCKWRNKLYLFNHTINRKIFHLLINLSISGCTCNIAISVIQLECKLQLDILDIIIFDCLTNFN